MQFMEVNNFLFCSRKKLLELFAFKKKEIIIYNYYEVLFYSESLKH